MLSVWDNLPLLELHQSIRQHIFYYLAPGVERSDNLHKIYQPQRLCGLSRKKAWQYNCSWEGIRLNLVKGVRIIDGASDLGGI